MRRTERPFFPLSEADRREGGFGKTAECVADGLGEGCGLSFLFASYFFGQQKKMRRT